jgi:manganese-dependent inorganic pyrophosphatase
MRAMREAQKLFQVILMVTNVEAEASDLWVIGDRIDLFERAFGSTKNGTIHMPGYMSRKKQVVPRIESVFVAAEKKMASDACETLATHTTL